MTITTDEWRAALEQALMPIPGAEFGKTVGELAAIAGVCEDTLKKTLRRLMAEGRLLPRRERRQGIDGVWRLVPTYSIKAEK